MHGMLDPQVLRRCHLERLCEAEMNRLTKELRAIRKQPAGWSSALAWELKRCVGRVLKILKSPKKRPARDGEESRVSKKGTLVRWGLEADEDAIAELMELNGMRRTLAFEERFIVAVVKPGGKVLAALRYRTEPKRLMLGLLVSDPWAAERPLAVALYSGAGELARQMGVEEVRARPVLHAEDYPREAGYRWRYPGGWRLDARQPLEDRKDIAAGGWRRVPGRFRG
jgi:hypothetical protein